MVGAITVQSVPRHEMTCLTVPHGIGNAISPERKQQAYAKGPNCVADCVWLAVPQPTEWQRIGNQIDAAMIFARSDFVNRGCIAWLDVLTGSALT